MNQVQETDLFYSLSTTIVHTLEELWRAILKTHIISPSGPRKADNDIYSASEAYMTLRMGAKETLSSFKERFNFALRRVAIIGGASEGQGIATTRFIKALDPARFAEFWKDLDTSVTLGGRQPPRTIEEAFQLAYDSIIKINSSFKYSNVNESQVLSTTTTTTTPTTTTSTNNTYAWRQGIFDWNGSIQPT